VIHPDAHTLELYVLNAESISAWRDDIGEHLRHCAGCRALVREMSEFYDQLDQELRKAPEQAEGGPGSALSKRAPDLTIWEERLAVGRRGGWMAPARKLRYYIRKYPIAAAGTTFAFTALAGLGLFMGYRELSEDVDPAYAELNQVSGYLEVYNRGNDLLWKRIVQGIDTAIAQENVSGAPRYTLIDYDGNGRKELLTTLRLSGTPAVPAAGLHIIDGEGGILNLDFSRRISWRGTPYELPVTIQSGNLVGIDTTVPGRPEILVTATNDRSPNAILRMDQEGNILGEYWHHGQFRAFYLHDLDGDGRAELILSGSNDVNDDTAPAEPVFIVLDPRKIVGTTESLASPGYGYARSEAELYYVKLPLTDINVATRSSAGVDMVRVEPDRVIAYWRCGFGDNRVYGLDFVFARSLEPLRVISTTQIKEYFDREYSRKQIATRMDDAYLNTLKSEIRFWDGSGWTPEAVAVGHAAAEVPAAGRPGPR
jgi:hypothetical protein